MSPLAITTGEPAGIGPDIALRAALAATRPLRLLGDEGLLAARAGRLGLPWPLPAPIEIEHVPMAAPCTAGRLDPHNAAYVLALLDRAIDGCRGGAYAALITAPVHKGAIAESGVPFTGHTEYLAERCGGVPVVMLLAAGALRVALASTHLPLAQVPAAITRESLRVTLDVLDRDLRHRFGLPAPRIAVCGLNPHAGEGGHLGREEIDTIAPAVAAARARGIDAVGPLPADTVFVPAQARGYDAILAMYHDQGLAPFKQASFGQGVNVTLGLPFVRTSVDHGTALELAGSGRADASSLVAAIDLAGQLVQAAQSAQR